MKKALTCLFALAFAPLAMAQEGANCEVFLRQPVMLDGQQTGAFMDTYVPAEAFMDSVYDDLVGFMTHVNGQPIKAVFCTRANVIPTLRDFPILATGLPFVISSDFDSIDSPIITVYYKDESFKHVYRGPDLSDSEQIKLDDAMDIFNLQPHSLGK